jgi:TatD DNase family protein
MRFIDTHAHLDGEEFNEDLPEVVARARAAGLSHVFLPCVDLASVDNIKRAYEAYPDFFCPMIGLQPEEVKEDYREVLAKMHEQLLQRPIPYIAVGEVGLDFYWSREFEQQQLAAFEEQVKWSVETQLPLNIHCRKAQNELLAIMRNYEKDLPGGVFHCFTGNQREAEEYLRFERFALGIGGVLTFKSSHLREDLPAAVPLSRIVLETDSPYMAPVPNRGKRNESAYVRLVLDQLAQSYGVSAEEVAEVTNANVERIFHIS